MDGYRHEGGDGSVARTEIARWSEPQGLQARQRNGKDLHIVVCRVAMEDNDAELTTILLQQLRDVNVSLMFGCDVADVGLFQRTPLSCDAGRWSHGRAAGS